MMKKRWIFIIYLFIELWLIIKIGSVIGVFWTFVEIIGSAILAVGILTNLKAKIIDTVQSLIQKKMDKSQFFTYHISRIIGALMLILPGFLTDMIGILLQISWISLTINKLFYAIIPHSRNSYSDFNSKRNNNNVEQIIDVEVISDTDNKHSFSKK